MAGLVGPLVVLMFLLSKLLPLLLLPLGISLLLLIWGASQATVGRASAPSPCFGSLLLHSPLRCSGADWSAVSTPHGSHGADASAPGSCGGAGHGLHPAPGPARVSEWLDADRFFAGLEAYAHINRQGEDARLIFTGGWWPTMPAMPPEGDVLRLRALALGLSADAVFSTSKVRNTADEAQAVAAMLPAGSTVLLVTSAFHMLRAQRLFQRQGLSVLPFPVDFQASGAWAGNPWRNPLNLVPTAGGLQQTSRAIREAIGRTLYRSW